MLRLFLKMAEQPLTLHLHIDASLYRVARIWCQLHDDISLLEGVLSPVRHAFEGFVELFGPLFRFALPSR